MAGQNEDESFRSFCDEQTRPQYYDTLKDRFIRHAQEQTKVLVFVFVSSLSWQMKRILVCSEYYNQCPLRLYATIYAEGPEFLRNL